MVNLQTGAVVCGETPKPVRGFHAGRFEVAWWMHIAFIAQQNPNTKAFPTADHDHHLAKVTSKPT